MTEYNIVHKPLFHVIGIECRTVNSLLRAFRDIPKHWERFYKEKISDSIPNKVSDEVIAVYCDYEGDHTQPYSLILGCEVNTLDSVPHGMQAKTIPGSSYALFRAIGPHPQALLKTWSHIWQQSHLPRTYAGDYEIYGKKFLGQSPQEVEVYVGIQTP